MAADATGIREYKGAAKATTIVAGITNASTSFSIADSTGWPTGSVGNFIATLEQGLSTEERILCSGLAGGVLTVVTRGYDNTTAVAHATGSSIAHTISAVDIAEGNYIANFKSAPSKATPVGGDNLPLSDSASSGILKNLTLANLASWLWTAIASLTGKTTPVGADTFVISDSAASGVGKSVTWTNILATAKAYFDGIYAAFKGPAVNTQTASYVLVASDVGKRVVMNAAGATTITVNTSLFGAGDTLEILNIGAGVCTITAGTATVACAGSLALVQNAGGKLYFTSAGASTFIPSGVSGASGGMTLLNPGGTALTGAAITLSAIDQTYKELKIVIEGFIPATSGWQAQMQFNADATASRHLSSAVNDDNNKIFADTAGNLSSAISGAANSGSTSLITARIIDYTNASTWKIADVLSITTYSADVTHAEIYRGVIAYNQIGAVTSLLFKAGSGNLSAGTVYLYGVK